MMKRGRKVIRKRRRKDICKSHEPRREIPFDPVIEILTRLPAKSLMKFKSVSKLWSSLICSKYFTNRFPSVSSALPRLYMWLGFDENHVKNVLLSSSASDDTTFVVDQDLTIPAMEGYKVSHVFRGLMCFTKRQSARIYNTTTRQLVVLPAIEESNIIVENHKPKRIVYRIGHDPVHDQYKVVCTVSTRRHDKVGTFVMSEHWVLILGRDGDVSSRWRKIPSRCQALHLSKQGLTINGIMYYLAWGHLPYPVLVSFDMISEEISMLQLPEEYTCLYFIDLLECGGRVALLDHNDLVDEGVMELRVMEDAEKNRWSRKTFVLHPSQMHIVNMHMVDNMGLRVQGTTRNGEVIFVPENKYFTPTGKIITKPQDTSLFYVFLYNLQKNHMRKVEIMESSNRCQTKIWDVIGFDDTHENLMHL